MGKAHSPIDKPFLFSVVALVFAGFLIFSSASLGLLAREGASFTSVATGQILIGILGGCVALLITTRINYRLYKKYALPLFLFSIFSTLLVFVPAIGFSAGGATRWIDLGFTTFQPAEFLKLGFVIYLAALLSANRAHIYSLKQGVLPFVILSALVGIVLLLQPDTGTFLVILATGLSMLIAAGVRWRDISGLGFLSLIGLSALVFLRPYVMDRILTFLNPSSDPLGNGYQIQQSLIAIGSGHIFGRGFGQSVQKFDYLPEPMGDSIFAVAAEELGFIGASTIVILFLLFALRGYAIAGRTNDHFGGLLAVGISTYLAAEAFINIAAMLGVAPLTGIPLTFVSQGGSAMLISLASAGILLNISRHRGTK